MKGIYSLIINGKRYIGKDTQIHRKKRFNEHRRMLESNTHYNSYLQNAYNKYKEIEYEVLYVTDNIDNKELSKLEIKFIEEYGSHNFGYNLTTGGEGLGGYVYTPEQLQRKSENVSGSKNPMSKISEEEFDEMVEMFIANKTNKEIGEYFGVHDRYVSLIRHKRRLSVWWAKYPDYVPKESEGQAQRTRISEKDFVDIVKWIRRGGTNAEIERYYGLSSGTISRLRHRRTYKAWWERLIDNQEI